MSDYSPSEELQEALADVEQLKGLLDTARQRVRAAIAADMHAHPELTQTAMAEHVPFTEEYVRQIAREFNVPRRKQAGVRKSPPRAGRKKTSD